MFCLFISALCFGCGILYLVMGYEIPVGWVQLLLGGLCLGLSIWWLATRKKDKTPPTNKKESS